MRNLFLLLVAALAVGGCGSESTTPSAVTDASDLPADQIVYALRHNMTKDGIRTGVLTSDTAYMYETGQNLDLRGVSLEFYGDTGAPTGTLTSRTGEYELRTGSFVARGEVVLVTQGPNGSRRLETEELHYDVRGDRLWSDQPFVLVEGGRTTRGNSFRSDASFRNWEVAGARTEGGLPSGGSGISF